MIAKMIAEQRTLARGVLRRAKRQADYCEEHGVDFPTFDKWYKKTQKKVYPVAVTGIPSAEEAEIQTEADKVTEESKMHDPVRHPFKYLEVEKDLLSQISVGNKVRFGSKSQKGFRNNTAPVVDREKDKGDFDGTNGVSMSSVSQADTAPVADIDATEKPKAEEPAVIASPYST